MPSLHHRIDHAVNAVLGEKSFCFFFQKEALSFFFQKEALSFLGSPTINAG